MNRGDEMTRLSALIERGRTGSSVTVAVIVGTAGVGKTALAVHWGHRVADSFTDGNLYVNLRGFDPSNEPLSTAEVLSQFIRAIGLPGQHSMPPTVDERAALFRTLTQGRRILVMLDNAVSPGQVRPLIPSSPSCLVVITSRNDLPGLVIREGATRITVPTLSSFDSELLLSHLLPRRIALANDRLDLSALAARCAYLPIALRVAADVVARSEFATLDDLIGQLETHTSAMKVLRVSGDRDAAVESIFSWSYHALSTRAARLFRLIGLHPGTSIAIEAAVALSGVSYSECRESIDELSNAHLIKEAGPGRYRVHDLLRSYAISRAHQEESADSRKVAVGRLLSWYLHSTDAANRVLAPHRRHVPLPPLPDRVEPMAFGDYPTAMTWCEAERLNLVVGTRTAEALGLFEIAWKLASALFSFLYVRSYFEDWTEMYTVGCRAAARLGDRHAEGMMLNRLGVAMKEMGRFLQARSCFEQALSIRREAGDRSGEATTLSNIGLCLTGLGQSDRAIPIFHQALTIAQDAGDDWTRAWTLHNLGTAQAGVGELDAAQRSQEEALTLARRLDDKIVEGLALQQLGLIHHTLGNYDDALATQRDALSVGRSLGHRTIEAAVLLNTGETLQGRGWAQEALAAYTEASILFEAMGNRRMTANSLARIARVMGDSGLGQADEIQAIMERANDSGISKNT
ncbi:ATP-binding protein [Rugosimonospora africana]|uniref:ATP-binding protein n=1 Tax=Rugosimonospora africana TaxID=556532 RepID=UPI0019446002|nr:tetratricopeptide repeat protein [Rugosimonospora africana]